MTTDATPQMPGTHEIQLLLENLVLEKALGRDGLTTYIFKHCASKIAPILQIRDGPILLFSHLFFFLAILFF